MKNQKKIGAIYRLGLTVHKQDAAKLRNYFLRLYARTLFAYILFFSFMIHCYNTELLILPMN